MKIHLKKPNIIKQIKDLKNEDIKQIKELCCFLLRKTKTVNDHPGRPRIYNTAEEAKQSQIQKMQEWRKKQKALKRQAQTEIISTM